MRIHIELDPTDKYHLVDFRNEITGGYKALIVEIEGRKFSTWYKLQHWRMYDPGYEKAVEEQLTRSFEVMIERVLRAALKNCKDGVELMERTDDELREILRGANESETNEIK